MKNFPQILNSEIKYPLVIKSSPQHKTEAETDIIKPQNNIHLLTQLRQRQTFLINSNPVELTHRLFSKYPLTLESIIPIPSSISLPISPSIRIPLSFLVLFLHCSTLQHSISNLTNQITNQLSSLPSRRQSIENHLPNPSPANPFKPSGPSRQKLKSFPFPFPFPSKVEFS